MENIRIVIADIRAFSSEKNQILLQIAPHYVEKYKKIKVQKTAMHELISGLLLKQYLDIKHDEQLTYNKYGKPLLTSGEKYFNLSHSGDFVVLAIADCEVGVDIEKVRPCHDAIVKKYFSTKQKSEIAQVENENRDKAFTKIWTGFEAMLKLKGTGFGENWDKEKGPLEKCIVQSFEMNDYFISVATEEPTAIEWELLPKH